MIRLIVGTVLVLIGGIAAFGALIAPEHQVIPAVRYTLLLLLPGVWVLWSRRYARRRKQAAAAGDPPPLRRWIPKRQAALAGALVALAAGLGSLVLSFTQRLGQPDDQIAAEYEPGQRVAITMLDSSRNRMDLVHLTVQSSQFLKATEPSKAARKELATQLSGSSRSRISRCGASNVYWILGKPDGAESGRIAGTSRPLSLCIQTTLFLSQGPKAQGWYAEPAYFSPEELIWLRLSGAVSPWSLRIAALVLAVAASVGLWFVIPRSSRAAKDRHGNLPPEDGAAPARQSGDANGS